MTSTPGEPTSPKAQDLGISGRYPSNKKKLTQKYLADPHKEMLQKAQTNGLSAWREG